MTDLDAPIAVARDDLNDIAARIGDLYDHYYAPDWQPDTGRSAPQHRSRANWVGAHTIQQTYIDVLAELCRAHWELGRNTAVPAHLSHRTPPQLSSPERAPHIEYSEALQWAEILGGMLAWCQGKEHERCKRPEPGQNCCAHHAVVQACSHVGSAKRHLDDLWPHAVTRPADHPMCVTCEQVERARDRRECWGCVKRRDRARRAG